MPSLHQPNLKFSNNTTKDRTAILISHRTVRMVDTIYVLENGRIVKYGHHDDLIRRGGMYAHYIQGISVIIITQKRLKQAIEEHPQWQLNPTNKSSFFQAATNKIFIREVYSHAEYEK